MINFETNGLPIGRFYGASTCPECGAKLTAADALAVESELGLRRERLEPIRGHAAYQATDRDWVIANGQARAIRCAACGFDLAALEAPSPF